MSWLFWQNQLRFNCVIYQHDATKKEEKYPEEYASSRVLESIPVQESAFHSVFLIFPRKLERQVSFQGPRIPVFRVQPCCLHGMEIYASTHI